MTNNEMLEQEVESLKLLLRQNEEVINDERETIASKDQAYQDIVDRFNELNRLYDKAVIKLKKHKDDLKIVHEMLKEEESLNEQLKEQVEYEQILVKEYGETIEQQESLLKEERDFNKDLKTNIRVLNSRIDEKAKEINRMIEESEDYQDSNEQ